MVKRLLTHNKEVFFFEMRLTTFLYAVLLNDDWAPEDILTEYFHFILFY